MATPAYRKARRLAFFHAYDTSADRYTVDPDGAGDAAPFTFGNPDFNFRSVRGNAVLRWEFRPGSALYLVWNENRADVAPTGNFSFNRDFDAALSAPSDDVFMVKISYWLGF